MDLKVILTAFSAVFLAEMADKTQLIGIALSAKTGKPLMVWLGSVAGYMLTTVISVLLGALFAKYMRPDIIKYAGGALFVVIGILMLAGKV